MTKLFTYEDVLPVIEKVVADVGSDFKYTDRYFVDSPEACRYRDTPKFGGLPEPACIVGRVLDTLGVKYDNRNERATFNRTSWAALFDNTAVNALRRAQRSQDFGDSWGVALEEFKRVSVDNYNLSPVKST